MKTKKNNKIILTAVLCLSYSLCSIACSSQVSDMVEPTESDTQLIVLTESSSIEPDTTIVPETREARIETTTAHTTKTTPKVTTESTQPATVRVIEYETDSDDSEKCGDNIKWDYYENNSQLWLHGKGAMYDYDNSDLNHLKSQPAPWMPQDGYERSRSYDIKEIMVGEGITEISGFGGCDVGVVDLPSTLKKINAKAFYNCMSLRSITIPSSVTEIAVNAFGSSVENEQTSSFRICGFSGTEAEHYAIVNGFRFYDLNQMLEYQDTTPKKGSPSKEENSTIEAFRKKANETRLTDPLGKNYAYCIIQSEGELYLVISDVEELYHCRCWIYDKNLNLYQITTAEHIHYDGTGYQLFDTSAGDCGRVTVTFPFRASAVNDGNEPSICLEDREITEEEFNQICETYDTASFNLYWQDIDRTQPADCIYLFYNGNTTKLDF